MSSFSPRPSPVSPTAALRGGPVPLYHQLRQVIRERIASGEWATGDQIPTIQELCETYGVSRITVVQALSVLSQEGLLTRRQGKGVFVAEPKIEHGPVRLVSFTEESQRRGHHPESRVLSLRRELASEDVAAKLEIEEGESVVVLERLRLSDGEPMGRQTARLPERFFPGLAELRVPIASLYVLLQDRYGVVPTQATDTYVPIKLDRLTAQLLGVEAGAPAFSVERVARDQRGRIVEYVVSVLRGDRYKVVLQLQKGLGG